MLVEELQRSVIFFTRANSQLKQKNESLEAMLFAARSQIEQSGGGASGGNTASVPPGLNTAAKESSSNLDQKPAALPQGASATSTSASPRTTWAASCDPSISAFMNTLRSQCFVVHPLYLGHCHHRYANLPLSAQMLQYIHPKSFARYLRRQTATFFFFYFFFFA